MFKGPEEFSALLRTLRRHRNNGDLLYIKVTGGIVDGKPAEERKDLDVFVVNDSEAEWANHDYYMGEPGPYIHIIVTNPRTIVSDHFERSMDEKGRVIIDRRI